MQVALAHENNNIVKNVDAFHDAFATTSEDGMWLAPEDRVVIW